MCKEGDLVDGGAGRATLIRGREGDAALLRRPAGSRSDGRCAVAVMAKASRPGACKTRLRDAVDANDTARLNTAFLLDIADNLTAAGRRQPIDAFMAFGPVGAADFFEGHFSPAVGLIEVALPNFGECLFQTIGQLLDLGYASACVLNSDSPTLPTACLESAAEALAAPGDRAVLGPSTDGGYYLLGLKAPHRRMFDDIDWSTELVADQTRARARELGLPLVELEPWFDVDDRASLHRLGSQLLGGSPAGAFPAPHTAALLPQLAIG